MSAQYNTAPGYQVRTGRDATVIDQVVSIRRKIERTRNLMAAVKKEDRFGNLEYQGLNEELRDLKITEANLVYHGNML
jgi:hypothetical protein